MIPVPLCPEAQAVINRTPLITESLPEPELTEKFDAMVKKIQELETTIALMKDFNNHREKRIRQIIADRDYYADQYERLRDDLFGKEG